MPANPNNFAQAAVGAKLLNVLAKLDDSLESQGLEKLMAGGREQQLQAVAILLEQIGQTVKATFDGLTEEEYALAGAKAGAEISITKSPAFLLKEAYEDNKRLAGQYFSQADPAALQPETSVTRLIEFKDGSVIARCSMPEDNLARRMALDCPSPAEALREGNYQKLSEFFVDFEQKLLPGFPALTSEDLCRERDRYCLRMIGEILNGSLSAPVGSKFDYLSKIAEKLCSEDGSFKDGASVSVNGKPCPGKSAMFQACGLDCAAELSLEQALAKVSGAAPRKKAF